jgi:flagellar hook-associated protein 1 FlgK
MSVSGNISLGAIMNTAASALQANQTALRVTSNNIANINTEGYNRRLVEFGPRLTAERLSGVSVDQIRRVADEFLAREALEATGSVGQLQVLSSYFTRVQGLIGSINDGNSVGARVSSAMTALQQLSTDPASPARRHSALSAVSSALSSLSGIATNVQSLRQDANAQIGTSLRVVNQLIAQIHDLNGRIKTSAAGGDLTTGLDDQREKAVSDLSKYLDIRTFEQPDGRLYVSLTDGTGLVSDLSSEFRYDGPASVSTSTVFPSLMLQRLNPSGGVSGPAFATEARIAGGELRGLLDMRDRRLPDLAEQLGQIGAGLAHQLNAMHNNSSAVPPPRTLSGVQTGLATTDALNFSGSVRVAVVDAQGQLVQQVNIDTSSLANVGALVTAINAGLGGAGTASFSNGVLSLTAANSAHGVAMLQDPASPALRGGLGLAHFFGLNNLVTATSPSNFAKGVQSSNAHGFAAGGQTEFVLRGTNGVILTTFTHTVPTGTTVANLLTSLNTAANGFGTFSLDSNGGMIMTPSAANAGARLEIKNDTTNRAATGVTLSEFFGLGTAMRQNQAMSLAIRSDIAQNVSRLALARLDVTSASVPGNVVLGAVDNRGAMGLADAANAMHGFSSVGGLSASTQSLNSYIAQISGLQADLATFAEDERLNRISIKEEVAARRDSTEGVNLDEELANMMMFQQAYNASARLMSVAREMFQTLLEAM